MRTENAPVIRLEDYRPTDYAITAVALDVSLHPEASRVEAVLSLSRREGTAPGTPLTLDGDGLELTGLLIDGETVPAAGYEAGPDRLTLLAPPAEPFALTVVTEVNPTANSELMGLYLSNGIYTTQCEAEGFRRITYFLDRPDVLAVYRTRIEAEKAEAPVLLGNGNLVESGDLPGTGHYAIWDDPFPKPSYLFAMVGGDLAAIRDTFRTASGRDVALAIYCEHGKEERCRWAMEALKRSMRWDEECFGREYDLDVFNIVAVSDFNMGAMENKGLNVFNDKYVLVDPETGTDQDYALVQAVIAHEYFHNWTGNRITCRNWFQLCLKEGLTVFRDQEFTSDMRSRPVKRITDVVTLREHQFPEDAGPLAHPVRPVTYREINNFYTATVYEKGAEICRMLKTVLGAEGFRAGMDLYFDRHDGDAATIEDFLTCFSDETGQDLGQFALWYSQAGTPTLTVRHSYDAQDHRLVLDIEQDLPETPDKLPKQPMHIPVAFGLVGPDGQDLSYSRVRGSTVRDGVIHLTGSRAQLVFEGVNARPVPSLLRRFSAPVHLKTDLSLEARLFLIGHDTDPFSRWEATNGIAKDLIAAGAAAIRAGDQPRFDPRFAEELGRLAADDTLDPAFRALALTLPSEGDIAQHIGFDVDPDAVHAARQALLRHLGAAIGPLIGEAAGRMAPDRDYAPDAANAGRRSLRFASWSYAVAAGTTDGTALLRAFEAATNLTERLAALRLLVHQRLDHAQAALASFYERYRTNPLVLDKWFAVQATAPAHATLERVMALKEDPAFSLRNPNRVYSLIRSFAAANPVGFNRPDGAGYDFLAETIAVVDGRNPSVAARLATGFRSFRLYEAERRDLAEAALRRLAARDNLSRDVSDILERTLRS